MNKYCPACHADLTRILHHRWCRYDGGDVIRYRRLWMYRRVRIFLSLVWHLWEQEEPRSRISWSLAWEVACDTVPRPPRKP